MACENGSAHGSDLKQTSRAQRSEHVWTWFESLTEHSSQVYSRRATSLVSEPIATIVDALTSSRWPYPVAVPVRARTVLIATEEPVPGSDSNGPGATDGERPLADIPQRSGSGGRRVLWDISRQHWTGTQGYRPASSGSRSRHVSPVGSSRCGSRPRSARRPAWYSMVFSWKTVGE